MNCAVCVIELTFAHSNKSQWWAQAAHNESENMHIRCRRITNMNWKNKMRALLCQPNKKRGGKNFNCHWNDWNKWNHLLDYTTLFEIYLYHIWKYPSYLQVVRVPWIAKFSYTLINHYSVKLSAILLLFAVLLLPV